MGAAHIELGKVPEEEGDGLGLLHLVEVLWVLRVVEADTPGRRAEFPCATQGGASASAAHNRRAGVAAACGEAACGEAACGEVRAPELMAPPTSTLSPPPLLMLTVVTEVVTGFAETMPGPLETA